jgi:hypothetical protein
MLCTIALTYWGLYYYGMEGGFSAQFSSSRTSVKRPKVACNRCSLLMGHAFSPDTGVTFALQIIRPLHTLPLLRRCTHTGALDINIVFDKLDHIVLLDPLSYPSTFRHIGKNSLRGNAVYGASAPQIAIA